MTFLTISGMAQGILSFWASLIFLMFFFNLLSYVRIGKGKTKYLCVFLLLFSFALLQILFQQMDGDLFCPITLPLWGLILLLVMMTVIALADQWRIAKWHRLHVSAASIKEALDTLPTGLCYALPEGLPFLVNEKMEEIGRSLLGESLADAKIAWNTLEAGKGKGLIKSGQEPIYELSDGRVYSFRRDELKLKEGRVLVITATDVTLEYQKTKELSEKQKRAAQINARLKALQETIEYVSMSRELLQLKVALHDNLGRILLSAKRWFLNPQFINPTEFLSLWKEDLGHLIGEAPKEWQVPYYAAKKEAASLGIDLQIVGTLPEEEELLPIIDQAISTHVINVLRHADGHVAMVHIEEYDKEYVITFRNDGKVPSGEIREAGGLGNLKRQAEALGGNVELRAKPRFQMILTLPRRR